MGDRVQHLATVHILVEDGALDFLECVDLVEARPHVQALVVLCLQVALRHQLEYDLAPVVVQNFLLVPI